MALSANHLTVCLGGFTEKYDFPAPKHIPKKLKRQFATSIRFPYLGFAGRYDFFPQKYSREKQNRDL
jgi:hypothetical protein